MRTPTARYRCPISLFGENRESIVVTLVSGIVASMVTLSAHPPLPGRKQETAALSDEGRDRGRADREHRLGFAEEQPPLLSATKKDADGQAKPMMATT